MNKFLIFCLAVMLWAACAVAVYPRAHYYTGHKTYLGGAGYAYRPVKYASHGIYRKPVLHHATPVVYAHKSYSKPVVHHATPIVYAHKSYSKPRVTHYIKPSYHHEVPHYAPVYHSKPVYYLGGHAGHGIAYKPTIYGHGPSYVYKGHH